MSTRVLTGADVQKVINGFKAKDLVEMSKELFLLVSKQEGIETPHRLSIDTGSQVSLFMPSYVSTGLNSGLAIKIVSVPKEGSAGIGATTLVIDPQTGATKGIVNARKLTALRTAAGSALATKLLANPKSTNLVAFGAGAQIEEHINLLVGLFPSINSVTVINRSQNARLSALINRLSGKHPSLSLTTHLLSQSSQIESAVNKAQIICCATSSTTPLFASSFISPGTHLNLIGSYKPTMHEIDSDLVKRVKKVVVDSKEACLIESGELIDAGFCSDDLVELGEICAHSEEAKERCKELKDFTKEIGDVRRKDVTIFKSVGVGAQDVMIASAVLKKAEEMGIGSLIEEYD